MKLHTPSLESPYPRVAAYRDSAAMRRGIHAILCHHDRLHAASAPLWECALVAGKKAYGLMFHVEGPRSLKPSAVWVAEEHRVVFFDTQGQRFHEQRLSESPG